MTSIDSSAFYDCYRLVEIYNKSSIEIVEGSYSNGYVGYYAKNVYTSEGGSKLCVDLNGYVIYTDGDNKILIAYRGNAIDLILPTGIVSINQYAFYNYSRLNSITMSNSIMFIGEAAFSKCSNLASITIPNGVTSICDSAFSECSSLVSVKIPNSVTMLGSSAFYNCNSLTSVTIPNSVTRIESYTFSGCSSLESINFKGTIEQWNAIIKGNSWNYGVATDCTITCSDGTI